MEQVTHVITDLDSWAPESIDIDKRPDKKHEGIKTRVKTHKLTILSIFNLLQKSCEGTINTGESVERRELSYIAGGM